MRNTFVVDPGDKITLVTRDVVLVCEVLIVRPRGDGERETSTEADAAGPRGEANVQGLGSDDGIQHNPTIVLRQGASISTRHEIE